MRAKLRRIRNAVDRGGEGTTNENIKEAVTASPYLIFKGRGRILAPNATFIYPRQC